MRDIGCHSFIVQHRVTTDVNCRIGAAQKQQNLFFKAFTDVSTQKLKATVYQILKITNGYKPITNRGAAIFSVGQIVGQKRPCSPIAQWVG